MFDRVTVVVHVHVNADTAKTGRPAPLDEEDYHPRDNKEEVNAWKKFMEDTATSRSKDR